MQNNISKTWYLALLFPHTQLSAFSFFCLFLPPKRRPTLYRSPTRKTQLNSSTFSPKRKPPSVLLSHNSTAPPLRHHPSPALHLSALPISHSQQFLPLSHPQFFSPTTLSTLGFLPPGLLLGSTPIKFLFLFLVANSSLGWVCREIRVWFWEYLLIHGCILIEIREAPTPQGRTTPLEGVAEENKTLTLHPQSVWQNSWAPTLPFLFLFCLNLSVFFFFFAEFPRFLLLPSLGLRISAYSWLYFDWNQSTQPHLNGCLSPYH